MILVGLTGSIGMGKSATAQMFRDYGVPVYDADAAVHTIYGPGGSAVAPIEAAFPGVTSDQGVDRIRLRDRVLGDSDAVKRLEAIVHPLVGAVQKDFLAECRERNEQVVVLDVPLLFETGGHLRVDVIVVVSAPAHVQRQRVLERPGMTEEAFEAILARQLPDSQKRDMAHFVVDTSQGFDHAREKVGYILEQLKLRANSGDAGN